MQKQPGTIYFVEERDLLGFPTPNYVKIGLVKNNEKGRSSDDRKDEHQTGNPRPLIVVDSIDTEANVSALETMIHQSLAMYRHRGEWFVKPNGELKLFLEKAKNLNNIVFNKVEKSIQIDAFSKQEDNGSEIDATKEILEIHATNKYKSATKKLDEEKKIIELTLEHLQDLLQKILTVYVIINIKKALQDSTIRNLKLIILFYFKNLVKIL